MMDKIKEILYTFVCVVTGVLFSCALFITIFYREDALSVNLLWEILATSLVCAAGNLFFLHREQPKRRIRVLAFFHYLYINVVVFGCAALFDWFDIGNWKMSAFLFLSIVVIYVAVCWGVWHRGRKESQILNQHLKEYQEKKEISG
ncbi:MAG: DUF3021 domain-containing protein [Roseburia sp.]|nr:DUF3021 domain-containing protein [Ruminococcus sp.]MCM1155854.1 DUF3021 domain-containing protein [Roseburia sp.]MCM1242500.1 DUF3021 domain-containing protein [Roseburia sp.]